MDLKRAIFGLVRGLSVKSGLRLLVRPFVAVFAKVVDGVRRGVLLLVLINLVLQLVTLSFGGTLVTAILLWGGEDKLFWLFVACATVFVLGASAGAILMSRRTWLRVAGVSAAALGEAKG